MSHTKRFLCAAALAALFTAAAVPAGAQTTPNGKGGGTTTPTESAADTLWACYIPHSGLVYRVRVQDPTETCKSHRHVLFSWNRAGPQGDPGLACWDTNGNGVQDSSEDTNGDGVWDAADCQGSGAADGTSENIANTLVLRDDNGGFAAGPVSLSNGRIVMDGNITVSGYGPYRETPR